MISVVIPAHNEASVIDRCLRSLTEGAREAEVEVIVVCNGCQDDTARRAAAHGAMVDVIETDVASKSHALNLGDRRARGFPRFFVDADVVMTVEAMRRVALVLEEGTVLAASPRVEVALEERGWLVRAYHEIWMRLPYIRHQMLGSGVYALSKTGRQRFESFPDIIADDEFIRRLFCSEEKTSVSGASFTVVPPRTLKDLIHIGIRRRKGMDEIRAIYPESFREEYVGQRLALARLLIVPRLWPALAVYAYVKGGITLAYNWQRTRGRHGEWRRDDSSRVAE